MDHCDVDKYGQHVCVHVCICVCVGVCICMYVCMYIHTYTHARFRGRERERGARLPPCGFEKKYIYISKLCCGACINHKYNVFYMVLKLFPSTFMYNYL